MARNYDESVDRLAAAFLSRAADCDETDTFVGENWAELRTEGFFSAMVPQELGGGGVTHGQMCRLIRRIARSCSSTALAFSMHQHLIAAAVWNYRNGNPGERLLRHVAGGEAVLVSTGANDWLDSSGVLDPCEGGFRFSGTKAFASGCPAGDLLITSGRYNHPSEGWQVLHFPVSLGAGGVRIAGNWKAMGMRGTGSHTIHLDNVFVPAETVGLRRPMGKYHRVWDVVLTVAAPLISAAYVGIADAAFETALQSAAAKRDDVTASLVGELANERTVAVLAFESMVATAADLGFQPSAATTSEILSCKTIATEAVVRTAAKALALAGGTGYLRAHKIERLVRDALAGQFHPLAAPKQHLFTGRIALGLEPEGGSPSTFRSSES